MVQQSELLHLAIETDRKISHGLNAEESGGRRLSGVGEGENRLLIVDSCGNLHSKAGRNRDQFCQTRVTYTAISSD